MLTQEFPDWRGPDLPDVVALGAQGLSHKDIATRLKIAPATVRNHIAHAYERLGVRNRAELTALLHRSA